MLLDQLDHPTLNGLAGDNTENDLGIALGPLFETLLWPLATVLLLAPQRRAHDPDENRPL